MAGSVYEMFTDGLVSVANMEDLAMHLAVSVGTVSRVSNAQTGMNSPTSERALAVAQDLGYRPDSTARPLATSRTRTVLFAVRRNEFPPAEDPFHSRIMQGAEEILATEGFCVVLVTFTDEQLAAGPEALRGLQEWRADGVVLAGPDIPPGIGLGATALGLPVMLVDNTLSGIEIPAILADNEGGCRAATNHLAAVHGHRVIGLLRGAEGSAGSEERATGYRGALEETGLTPHVVSVSETTVESGFEAATRALEACPAMSAIVAVNDAMAIGAIRAARSQGRQVPRDLAIVGFGNISWAEYSEPPLTTVDVPTREMGRLAARFLVDRLEGALTVASRTVLSTELVIRTSCGCRGTG